MRGVAEALLEPDLERGGQRVHLQVAVGVVELHQLAPRPRQRLVLGHEVDTLGTSGKAAMSCEARVIVSGGVPRSRNATTSTRSSTPRSASRRLSATRPNRPTVNSEKAIVVIESAESSGARRKDEQRLAEEQPHATSSSLRCSSAPLSNTTRALAQLDRAVGGLPTRSRSWVAMTTQVPPALMSRSSWNTPRVARSSRLPVGSSASRIGGSFTSARAIATRCCSPPDSSRGIGLRLGREAHLGQHPHHPRGDRVAPRAGHLEREGHVLLRGAVLQQPEVLEHDAEPAPQLRARRRRAASLTLKPDTRTSPLVGLLLGEEQLEDGGLAGAGVAGEEDELALGDVEGDVLERGALG